MRRWGSTVGSYICCGRIERGTPRSGRVEDRRDVDVEGGPGHGQHEHRVEVEGPYVTSHSDMQTQQDRARWVSDMERSTDDSDGSATPVDAS